MIRIEKLRIVRFRGILDLTLQIGGRNFAVAGPNGTGKSGVVDAIEFALSGDVSRLSGRGRGDVSVRSHAPHVDYRDQPDDAMVELEGVVVASGTKFKIRRTVGNAKNPTITPNDADVTATIAELGRHKNTTLSRRELIQYILSTPGDRASEINALLQLDRLRDVRAVLQRIANSCERDHKNAKSEVHRAGEALATALGIPALKIPDLLAAVNERRAVLDLPSIQRLEANTSIKDGLTVAAEKAASGISKTVALAECEKLSTSLRNLPLDISQASAKSVARLNELAANKDFKNGVKRHNLLERAIELVEVEECPVCETEWKIDELVQVIGRRMAQLESVLAEKKQVQEDLEPLVNKLRETAGDLRAGAAYGEKLTPPVDVTAIVGFSQFLEGRSSAIESFGSPEEVTEAVKLLETVPDAVKEQANELLRAVKALPDTALRDAARDFLVAAAERIDAYRYARRNEAQKLQEHELAAQVFATYSSTYETGLNQIYAAIQDSFAELYREINHDDEGGFEASMAAQKAGLGLEVDFYGRGKFPPGAYHSEGHQDGMGVCLYLALMRHLYGEEFSFCVLDDVLMSVDSGHRRAVCRMLNEKFPATQFIFTTHDDVWLQNMQSSGLIRPGGYVQFRNWSVEAGPAEWVAEDIWTEIDADVEKNDIKRAAASLRHYLEFLGGQLCHNLRAPVVYRGDNRHALADLLPPALSAFKKALKEAKAAAQSWGNDEEYRRLEALQSEFENAVLASNAEQWSLNAKVHYNEWANLTQDEFRAVVSAYRALVPFLICDKCNGLLYISPEFGAKEALRCGCNQTNNNLKKKPQPVAN